MILEESPIFTLLDFEYTSNTLLVHFQYTLVNTHIYTLRIYLRKYKHQRYWEPEKKDFYHVTGKLTNEYSVIVIVHNSSSHNLCHNQGS